VTSGRKARDIVVRVKLVAEVQLRSFESETRDNDDGGESEYYVG
jgi:hypothetical protein